VTRMSGGAEGGARVGTGLGAMLCCRRELSMQQTMYLYALKLVTNMTIRSAITS
jgi:hypothetical protein